MNLRSGVLFLTAVLGSAHAASLTVPLVPGKTQIDWTLSATMHTVEGTFKLKRGTVVFDPETGKASGEVVVDLTTGASGNDSRDKEMHAKILESGKYPEAVFVPDSFTGKFSAEAASSVKLHGSFKIHGTAHELTLDVRTKPASDGRLEADITFDIPYIAWGMKDPSNFILKVGKKVQVVIRVNAQISTAPPAISR